MNAMSASMARRLRATSVAILLLWLGGCAVLDELAIAQTHRLEKGQFYVTTGAAPATVLGSAVILPARLDPELANSLSYGRRTGEFVPLVDAVDKALARQSCCARVPDPALPAGAPQVYVGSPAGEMAPAEAADQVLPQDLFPPMVLRLGEPTDAWRQSVASMLAARGAQHAILVTLGVSQYPKDREGAFGKKVVLGTGHEEPIRFLTAEDKLLEVLQLTGVLVDAQGRVLRAGAEGILARDTPFAAQVVDVEKSLDDRTLEHAFTDERREDLPGSPAAWKVALETLLAQLLTCGRGCR